MQQIDPNTPPKKKSGCLKALLVMLAVFIFAAAVVGFLCWSSYKWMISSPEAAQKKYPPIQLSAGEEEDVDRVIKGLWSAAEAGTDFDEYVTPAVFNAVIMKIMEGERAKGNVKPDAPTDIRGGFLGDKLLLEFTSPAPNQNEKKWLNGEILFDLEIVDGVITKGEVENLKLGGRPAPFVAFLIIEQFMKATVENSRKEKSKPGNGLAPFKLFKREKDRLHVILDGKKMRENEESKTLLPSPERDLPKEF